MMRSKQRPNAAQSAAPGRTRNPSRRASNQQEYDWRREAQMLTDEDALAFASNRLSPVGGSVGRFVEDYEEDIDIIVDDEDDDQQMYFANHQPTWRSKSTQRVAATNRQSLPQSIRPTSVLSHASSFGRKSTLSQVFGASTRGKSPASQTRIPLGPKADHFVTNSRRRRRANDLILTTLEARKRAMDLNRQNAASLFGSASYLGPAEPALNPLQAEAIARLSLSPSPVGGRGKSPSPAPRRSALSDLGGTRTSAAVTQRNRLILARANSEQRAPPPPLAKPDQNSSDLCTSNSSLASSSDSSSGSQFTQLVSVERAPSLVLLEQQAAAASQMAFKRPPVSPKPRLVPTAPLPAPKPLERTSRSRKLQQQQPAASSRREMQRSASPANQTNKNKSESVLTSTTSGAGADVDSKLRRGALKRDSIRRLRLNRQPLQAPDSTSSSSSSEQPAVDSPMTRRGPGPLVDASGKLFTSHAMSSSAATRRAQSPVAPKALSSQRRLDIESNPFLNRGHFRSSSSRSPAPSSNIDSSTIINKQRIDDSPIRQIKPNQSISMQTKTQTVQRESGRETAIKRQNFAPMRSEKPEPIARTKLESRPRELSPQKPQVAPRPASLRTPLREVKRQEALDLPKFERTADDEFKKRVEQLRKIAKTNVSPPEKTQKTASELQSANQRLVKPISTNWKPNQQQIKPASPVERSQSPFFGEKATWNFSHSEAQKRLSPSLQVAPARQPGEQLVSSTKWRRSNSSLASVNRPKSDSVAPIQIRRPTSPPPSMANLQRHSLDSAPKQEITSSAVVRLVVREKSAPKLDYAFVEQRPTLQQARHLVAPIQLRPSRAPTTARISSPRSPDGLAISSNDDSAIASSVSSPSLSYVVNQSGDPAKRTLRPPEVAPPPSGVLQSILRRQQIQQLQQKQQQENQSSESSDSSAAHQALMRPPLEPLNRLDARSPDIPSSERLLQQVLSSAPKRVHFNDRASVRSFESVSSLESNTTAVQMSNFNQQQQQVGSPDSATSGSTSGRLSAESPDLRGRHTSGAAIYAIRGDPELESQESRPMSPPVVPMHHPASYLASPTHQQSRFMQQQQQFLRMTAPPAIHTAGAAGLPPPPPPLSQPIRPQMMSAPTRISYVAQQTSPTSTLIYPSRQQQQQLNDDDDPSYTMRLRQLAASQQRSLSQPPTQIQTQTHPNNPQAGVRPNQPQLRRQMTLEELLHFQTEV